MKFGCHIWLTLLVSQSRFYDVQLDYYMKVIQLYEFLNFYKLQFRRNVGNVGGQNEKSLTQSGFWNSASSEKTRFSWFLH